MFDDDLDDNSYYIVSPYSMDELWRALGEIYDYYGFAEETSYSAWRSKLGLGLPMELIDAHRVFRSWIEVAYERGWLDKPRNE